MQVRIPTCIPDGHLHRMTYTRCRIDTINSPDDGHMAARNMWRIEINIQEKCALIGLFTTIYLQGLFRVVRTVHEFSFRFILNETPNKWRPAGRSWSHRDPCFWQDLYVFPRHSSPLLRDSTHDMKVICILLSNRQYTSSYNICNNLQLLHILLRVAKPWPLPPNTPKQRKWQTFRHFEILRHVDHDECLISIVTNFRPHKTY